MNGLSIICGDCRTVLKELPSESVQCCVTSPPYWGLRDYGHPDQIGLEKTPQAYVETMRGVFREVWRVLRNDGTLWLNLGDSYSGSGKGGNPDEGKQATNHGSQSIGVLYGKTGETARQAALTNVSRRFTEDEGIAPKNLIGIPWRVALALQSDGWYLRSDIIWHKPNPMPESVTDRPTKSHEYLFLLSKSEKYFYDAEAIREPFAETSLDRYNYDFGGAKSEALVEANKDGIGQRTRVVGKRELPKSYNGSSFTSGKTHDARAPLSAVGQGDRIDHPGRNRRSVWTVATSPYTDAHFATYPPDLIKPCILAGTKPGYVVLDPFGGSGTTGMVALELGRKAVLIELNADYAKLCEERCNVTPGLPLCV